MHGGETPDLITLFLYCYCTLHISAHTTIADSTHAHNVLLLLLTTPMYDMLSIKTKKYVPYFIAIVDEPSSGAS